MRPHTNGNTQDGPSGLRHGKISSGLLRSALGEDVLNAIAAADIPVSGSSDIHRAAKMAELARRALRELCGAGLTGGQLQVRNVLVAAWHASLSQLLRVFVVF